MISQVQFGQKSMTASKQAMPESVNFDGKAGINVSGAQNRFAANSNAPISKPGFSD